MCEETLKVMKESEDILVSVIEVFLYDPMLRHVLNYSLQEPNVFAEELVTTVCEKLKGREKCCPSWRRKPRGGEGALLFGGPRGATGSQSQPGASVAGGGLQQQGAVKEWEQYEKIDGTTWDTGASEAAQVDNLIALATDPLNLCQIFVGWNPWC